MNQQSIPCQQHRSQPDQTLTPATPDRPDATNYRRPTGQLRRSCDTGMATAEYAVATLAAVAFAGLLLAVLTSDQVRTALTDLITGALG